MIVTHELNKVNDIQGQLHPFIPNELTPTWCFRPVPRRWRCQNPIQELVQRQKTPVASGVALFLAIFS